MEQIFLKPKPIRGLNERHAIIDEYIRKGFVFDVARSRFNADRFFAVVLVSETEMLGISLYSTS